MAILALDGPRFVFPVAIFALEVISKNKPVYVLPLLFHGAVAGDAFPNTISLFPDVLPISVSVVAFGAIVLNEEFRLPEFYENEVSKIKHA